MNTRLLLSFASLSVALRLLAAEPPGDEGQPLAARITEITVYADRAQVVRQAPAQLAPGTSRHAFVKLPGWIDEGSVRVTLSPASAGKILDVQVRRTFLAKPTDEEFIKAEIAVRDLADQIATLDDEKGVLDAQTKHVDAIRMFSLDKFPKDVAAREVKPQEYGAAVEFIAESLRKNAAARRELEKKRRELQPELQARQRRVEDLRQRSQLEQRTVVVTVQAAAAATGTLTLSSMLPGATWEPVHELRASNGATNLALTSYATITQSTGEDWNGVALALSTQRSTETMKIPELHGLLLGGSRAAVRALKRIDTFKDANRNWIEQNGYFFNAANPSTPLQVLYSDNQKLMLSNSAITGRAFELLQQRGTSAHFAAVGVQTIRADGSPVRTPIGAVELAAKRNIVAAPELSLNATHTADITHTGKQPLLPGKVALYIDGAFLGLTEVDFVASGESFDVFLGVADQIKLSRVVDPKRSELYRSGTRTRMKVAYVLTVENLADKPATVQLTDRVPVSEVEEIRISSVKTTPEVKADTKGLLRWNAALGPKQSKEHRIEYTIEYPTDLPTRADPKKPNAAPGSSLHFESDLKLQIRSLEETLKK
ncbi:MAG: mucoidy inhibitor MuiA family protein [Pedosphaera sp.]|nr:mucoidy inhibitor MuiA family protein [Pedosphaera sp.]MST00138.1 mucoidy inhibitor MuiA family protein [Pedosphaera sp.]